MLILDNFILWLASAVSVLFGAIYLVYCKRRAWKITAASTETSLKSLNEIFLREYKLVRADALIHQLEPMVILKGDALTLHHNGKRVEDTSAILPIYHDLKSVAHIPLTVYNLIQNLMRRPEHESQLKVFRSELYNILVKLPEIFPEPKQLKVQQDIISKSIEILSRAIETPSFREQSKEENRFFRSFESAFLSNINTVAESQLNSMHAIMTRWCTEYQIDISQLRVLIIGGRGERRDNLPATYFERLLGEDGHRRIVFVEELVEDETKAKNIFSSWFINEDIGRVFFGDDGVDRLNKDVLMNQTTREYIERLVETSP